MARITVVDHARKDQGKCGRCKVEIRKGDPYRHASPGFRSRKLVRCMKPECRFRESELTTSMLADVYAAQEEAHDALDQAGDFEDAKDGVGGILADCAGSARDVADAYNEAAEAMGSAGEQHTERAEAIEAWCDDLESPTWPDAPDAENEEYADDADALAEAWAAWREEVLDEARTLVDGLEV